MADSSPLPIPFGGSWAMSGLASGTLSPVGSAPKQLPFSGRFHWQAANKGGGREGSRKGLKGAPLPLCSCSCTMWRALALEPTLTAQVLELLLDKVNRDVPYKENKSFLRGSRSERVATFYPLSVSVRGSRLLPEASPVPPPLPVARGHCCRPPPTFGLACGKAGGCPGPIKGS